MKCFLNNIQSLRQYNEGKLITQEKFSIEDQTNLAIQEKINEWEKEKEIEREKLDKEIKDKRKKMDEEFEDKKYKFTEEIEDQRKKLKTEKCAFEEEKKIMTKFQEEQSEWIELNVGGMTFQTSRSTLTKRNSFFSSMLSGRYKIER